jgi:cytoskeleton protein RodZ
MNTQISGGSVMTLPAQLKAAREARGWTVEQVGEQLRLPARVVGRMEAGDFAGLGALIYRRGYLRSFARLVGLEEEKVEEALRSTQEPEPDLVATGVVARGQYVTERYLRPATYVALTALIALPVVWWAASGRLGQELAGQRSFDLQPPQVLAPVGQPIPLDPSSTSESAPASTGGSNADLVRASLIALPAEAPASSLIAPETTVAGAASVADDATAVPEEGTAESVSALGSGRHEALLILVENSWVEVLTADGRRLHQGLMAPGQWRFRADGRVSVTIGNSRSARLIANGREVELDSTRSSNDVARVDLFRREG